MHALTQGLSDPQQPTLISQARVAVDAMLTKVFGPAALKGDLAIQKQILASADPVGEAGAFYESLLNEMLFEFMPDHTDEYSGVFESLLAHGVNVIDLGLQAIKMPLLSVSKVSHLVPGFTGNAALLTHNRGGEPFLEAVARLDDFYARALTLECFAPDLANRVGYPRIYTGQQLGIPLNNPSARVFALVLQTPSPLIYIANSPLMQACMKDWFDEISDLEGGYPHVAIGQMLNDFNNDQRDAYGHGVFHGDTDAPTDLKIGALLKAFAYELSHLNLQTEVPLAYRPADAGARWLPQNLSCLTPQEYVTVASQVVATRSFTESRRVLLRFFEQPEAFVRLLVANEVEEHRAFSLFAHALGDHMEGHGISPSFPELRNTIDLYRQIFQAAGYSDLKGTHALDTLCLDYHYGDFFNEKGYLRTVDMHLNEMFCSRGDVFGYSQRHAETVARREMKVELALSLNQIQLLLPSARHMLDMSSPKGHDRDFEIPLLIESLIERNDVQLSDFITTRGAFKRAMGMGMKAEVLLKDSRLVDIMGDTIDSILEDDLGL